MTDECLSARSLSGREPPENDEDRWTRRRRLKTQEKRFCSLYSNNFSPKYLDTSIVFDLAKNLKAIEDINKISNISISEVPLQ